MEKAQSKDRDELFELINLAYEVERGSEGVGFKNCGRYTKMTQLEEQMQDMFVIRKSDTIVAAARIQVTDGVAFAGPLAVHPEHQGQGYGKVMLNFAQTFGSKLHLTVISCRSDLLPMYEKLGFAKVKAEPLEKYIPAKKLTRQGLEMITLERLS